MEKKKKEEEEENIYAHTHAHTIHIHCMHTATHTTFVLIILIFNIFFLMRCLRCLRCRRTFAETKKEMYGNVDVLYVSYVRGCKTTTLWRSYSRNVIPREDTDRVLRGCFSSRFGWYPATVWQLATFHLQTS